MIKQNYKLFIGIYFSIYLIIIGLSYQYVIKLDNKCECEDKIVDDKNINLLKVGLILHSSFIIIIGLLIVSGKINTILSCWKMKSILLLCYLLLLLFVAYVLYFHYKLNDKCNCGHIQRTYRIIMLVYYIYVAATLGVLLPFKTIISKIIK